MIVEASEPDQFAAAFEKAHVKGADAIHVWNGPLVFRHSVEVVGLAARYNLPAIYFDRRYVLDGRLISYAPNQADSWRRAAVYVDKIPKGENPTASLAAVMNAVADAGANIDMPATPERVWRALSAHGGGT